MSADVISDEQFAAAGNVPGGGASRRYDDKTKAPETGIYVSTEKPEILAGAPVSPKIVTAHRDLVGREHASPSYQGIWNSGDEETGEQGVVYVDHSRRYLSPRLAHFMAASTDQVSLYDATGGKVRSMKDPETTKWANSAPLPKGGGPTR